MKNQILIFACIGDDKTYNSWLNSKTNADFFVVYYGNDLQNFERVKEFSRFAVLDRSPSKFEKIYRYFSQNQFLFSEYEYIWLPDDDVWINTNDVNSFFEYAISRDLLISQPSMIGFGAKNQFKKHQQGIEIIYSDWVEAMAPFFNSKTLATCLDTFSKSQTGWGIEHVWAALISCPKDRIAVVHKYYLVHTKRVGSRYGRFSVSGEEDKARVLQIYGSLMVKFGISSEPRIFRVVKLNISIFDLLTRKIKTQIDLVHKIGIRELSLWVRDKLFT